jgi:hypothetical protein
LALGDESVNGFWSGYLVTHALAVDALAKNSEDWRTERMFLARRVDHHEGWIHKLAAHLGLKL